MSRTLEILREGRALITSPGDWRQGWADGDGGLCADVALWRAGGYPGCDASKALARAMGWQEAPAGPLTISGFIWVWNDSHSHVEVLAAFDRAISFEQALVDEDIWRVYIPSDTDLVMTSEGTLTYA